MRKTVLKRATAVMAAAAMAISALSGCGGAQNTTTAAPAKQAAGTTAAGAAATKAAAATTAGTAGTTKAAASSDHASWVSDTPIEVSILMMDSANQPLKNDAPAHQEITKKTNVKLNIQIVPSSSYKDKKNILLGTNNFPDIVYLQSMDDVVTYGNNGIFEPLMKHVNEKEMPNFYKFWQQYPDMKKYLLDGELYVFPVVAREETANGFGPVIREDLMKEQGLSTPKTFDELLDDLIKLKKAYPDTIPWTGRKGTTQLLKTTSYMLGSGYDSNGLYYDFDKDGGRYVFGPASQEFKKVLEYLNKAYKAGVLDPDFATSTDEQLSAKISSGKALFFLDNSGFGQNYTKSLRKAIGNDKATMQVLPIPANSTGKSRAMAYATELPGRFFALNANAKNKDKIIKFIDWMYSKEGSDISNYGVEGTSFEYNDKKEPVFKKDYVMKFKDSKPSDYYAIYADMGITKLDWCLWACNTKTWFEIQKMDGNWDDVADEYWKVIQNDKSYVQPRIAPSLTADESEKVKDVLVDVNTMLEKEYNKYIMGEEPIDNWDKVIAQEKGMGIEEVEKIYNDAEKRTAK